MKNVVKMLGIVALVAAIGFSMAACDDSTKEKDSPNSLEGNGVVWDSTLVPGVGIVFKDGDIYDAMDYDSMGWIATKGGTYTSTTILLNGTTHTYTISGNTLTLISPAGGTWTKKTGQKITFY